MKETNTNMQSSENSEPGKKGSLWAIFALVVLVLILLLLSGGGFLSRIRETNQIDPKDDLTQPYSEERQFEEPASELVTDFPSGFPFEQGVEFSQAYKYIPANSLEQQSTLSYISELSLQDNVDRFEQFFEDNQYDIITDDFSDGVQFYFATKPENDISILLETSNSSDTVSVIVTNLKK